MILKDLLLKEDIIKIKKENENLFILKSDKESQFFIDIKEASLNPYILKEIVNIITNIVYERECIFNKIGSIAIGGISIATSLSLSWDIPQIIIRSEKHDRGTQSQIIGDCQGQKILLIEDVATTGGSIINAVKAIRNSGGFCDIVMVIIDREEGAKELCKENNIELISILKKSDFGEIK